MKFTIRDLLWLTLVVALGVAWWLDRSYQARQAASWEADCREAVDLLNAQAGREAMLQQRLDKLEAPPNPSATATNPPKD